MSATPDVNTALAAVLTSVEQFVGASIYAADCPSDPHSGDDVDYRREGIALAARELVLATDALPADRQPVGWRAGVGV